MQQELRDFRDVVSRIATAIEDETSYFGDDTLRTIGLYVKAGKEMSRSTAASVRQSA